MHHSWAWEQRATSQPQPGQGQKKGGEGTLSQLLCSPLHAWRHVIISFLHLLTGVLPVPCPWPSALGEYTRSVTGHPSSPGIWLSARADNSTGQALVENTR